MRNPRPLLTAFHAMLLASAMLLSGWMGGASSSFAQDSPVIISNVTVEPSPFSPNDDGINETARFSFTLSEASTVTIEILFFSDEVDVDGTNLFAGELTDTLRLGDQDIPFGSDTIFSTTQAVAGLNEFVWDGVIHHNVGGQAIQLPDSTYTYMVRAEDNDADDTYRTPPVTGTITVDSKPPVISSINVSPNPFSPNSDGINDIAQARFTISGLPQNAKVGDIGFRVVYDPVEGTPIEFILDQPSTTGAFYTDDTLDVPFAPVKLQFVKRSDNLQNFSFLVRGGRILDSGDTVAISSTIQINADDPLGKAFVTDNRYSFIDKVENVNGSAADNSSNLVEVRTASGAVHVSVLDNEGNTVENRLNLDPPFIGNGIYSAGFGGTTVYDDGEYTFRITAVDESGNVTRVSRNVTAASNPIRIARLEVDPDTISPADMNNRYDFTNISYEIANRPGNVTIQVFRDSTVFVQANLVRTLVDNQPREQGGYSLSWDGKDTDGNYVSQGAEKAYTVVVTVFDPLTGENAKSSVKLMVDNLPPEEIFLGTLPEHSSQRQQTVTGRSEPGDSVVIFVNGQVGATISRTGSFGIFEPVVDLGGDGVKLITAISFDAWKNGPTHGDTLTLLLDTTPPLVTDTLISVGGAERALTGARLEGFGPSDTVKLVLQDARSGINLGFSTIQVNGPGGADVGGVILRQPPDRMLFVPSELVTDEGTYSLKAFFLDSLDNRDSVRVSFSVGEASVRPSLVEVAVIPAHNGFLNSRLDQQAGQSWNFVVQVEDNSGTGLDEEQSSLELVFVPDESAIEGESSVQETDLNFSVTQALSTTGSMDGTFELRMTVNDNDPTTGTLIDTVSFVNDTRAPDTSGVSFDADSSLLFITLKDSPAIAGREVSGVNILAAQVQVTGPDGGTVEAEVSHDGERMLAVDFGSKPEQAGLYTASVYMEDMAENSRTRDISFTLNVSGTPVLTDVTVTPGHNGFLNSRLDQQAGRNWNFTVQVQDNSGTGLDTAATGMELMFVPEGTVIEGDFTIQETTLNLDVTQALSTTGSMDGTFELRLKVDDNDPNTGTLTDTLTFINDTRAPDTAAVAFSADSSRLTVTLEDFPAVAGRAVSGVDILAAQVQVTGPGGGTLEAEVSHDGSRTLEVDFGSKPAQAGLYTASVYIEDRAENSRTRNIRFSLNVSGSLSLFPPDSSLVKARLPFVAAWITGAENPLQPGAGAYIQVIHLGQQVGGSTVVSNDTIYFVFDDTLATDGSDDGLYRMTVNMNITGLGSRDSMGAIFTMDNTPPDTASVEAEVTSDGVNVWAIFTDGGAYPDVAGIDQESTELVIEDPGGGLISPESVVWTGPATVEAVFGPLETAGLHRLRMHVRDRAGWATLAVKPMINTFGQARGRSTALVQEVPARTSANISFISGSPERRITRAVLRIFNLRGDLVRRVDVSDRIDGSGSSVTAEWMLVNDGGSLVGNGVFIYYWEVTYDNGSKERIRKTLAVARR